MTKKQKEFINKAKKYTSDISLIGIHIIPTGKKYKDSLGINGYNSMILIGETCDDQYYYLNKDQIDILLFYYVKDLVRGIDIPSETNCVRLQFGKPVRVTKAEMSCVPIPYDLMEDLL